MNRARFALLCVALALVGCGGETAGPEPLRVAAASDLQASLPILISAYRRDNPGVRVEPTFGASGQLAEQVRQGAPFDLFLSANRDFVAKLSSENVVDANSVKPYARGSLVVVFDAKRERKPTGLDDLLDPSFRAVAIANTATAPYGIAARQALEAKGIWGKVEPKVVVGESVRQAYQFVETGNADAGLVSRGLVGTAGMAAIPVPAELYAPIDQYLGVVSRSPRRNEAEKFAAFLVGDVARGIFRDLGFDPPGGATR